MLPRRAGGAALAECAQEMDDIRCHLQSRGAAAHDGEPRGRHGAWAQPTASAATAAATKWRRCSWRPPRHCLPTTTWAGMCPHEIDGPRAAVHLPSGGPGVRDGRREGGHLLSLVIEARPESVDELARALSAWRGGGARGERVQFRRHHRGFPPPAPRTRFQSRFIQIPGVLNVNLVYVNFEDETLR